MDDHLFTSVIHKDALISVFHQSMDGWMKNRQTVRMCERDQLHRKVQLSLNPNILYSKTKQNPPCYIPFQLISVQLTPLPPPMYQQ